MPQIYNKEDYTPIELPDLKKLKAKTGYSFLEQVELWFIRKYGRITAEEFYKNLWVTPKYYKKLYNAEKLAHKKARPYLTNKALQTALGMSLLNAPMAFVTKPSWAKDTLGYVKFE